MTFEEALKRILFRWWLIILIMATFTLAFFNWSKSNNYQASIGLGISFNNQAFIGQVSGQTIASGQGQTINRGAEYIYSLEEFSKYLQARFSSIEVQSNISRDAQMGVQSFDAKQPFYTVTPQNGGYVSISMETGSREQGEAFINAVKQSYNEIIESERNQGELEPFQIEPKTEFIETVTSISRPIQFQILPTVAGFLVGITVAALIPRKAKQPN